MQINLVTDANGWHKEIICPVNIEFSIRSLKNYLPGGNINLLLTTTGRCSDDPSLQEQRATVLNDLGIVVGRGDDLCVVPDHSAADHPDRFSDDRPERLFVFDKGCPVSELYGRLVRSRNDIGA